MNIFESKQWILAQVSSSQALFLESLKDMGERRNIPNISWNTAYFLIQKLHEYRPSTILEIGPANGFSTLMLHIGSPQAHSTSIECSRHAFEELRHNIQSFSSMNNEGPVFSPAEFEPKVTSDICQTDIGSFSLYYADAREILPAFVEGAETIPCVQPKSLLSHIPKQQFDCIFIDGAFRTTREFFDLSRPLLTPQGLIILDDAIKYRWKMEGFHEYLKQQGIAYELVQTDPDDGVMVIQIQD